MQTTTPEIPNTQETFLWLCHGASMLNALEYNTQLIRKSSGMITIPDENLFYLFFIHRNLKFSGKRRTQSSISGETVSIHIIYVALLWRQQQHQEVIRLAAEKTQALDAAASKDEEEMLNGLRSWKICESSCCLTFFQDARENPWWSDPTGDRKQHEDAQLVTRKMQHALGQHRFPEQSEWNGWVVEELEKTEVRGIMIMNVEQSERQRKTGINKGYTYRQFVNT